MEPLCLNLRDAAKLLGISSRTLWGLKKNNQIPYVLIGQRARFPVDQLKTWLAEKSKASQNPAISKEAD